VRVSFRQNLLPEEGGFAVKRKRFSVEQIVGVLKQAEVGVPVAELIRQVGITEQSLYRSVDRPSPLRPYYFRGQIRLATTGGGRVEQSQSRTATSVGRF